jgi:predicted metal-dependent hydrolase
MSVPVVRRLLVDMQAPIERHWCAGDAFRTAFFNVLSMSFPVGEQFFIDSVGGGWKALPPEAQQRLQAEVQGFVGQEASHRRLHGLYNGHLARLGLVNHWEPRARERLKLLERVDIRQWLAITAANEHFTAILAKWMAEDHIPGMVLGVVKDGRLVYVKGEGVQDLIVFLFPSPKGGEGLGDALSLSKWVRAFFPLP